MFVIERGEGVPVVFVPGLGCDNSMYRHQLESLRGMRRLAVDLRGCGRSPSLVGVPVDDILEAQVDDLARELTARNIDAAHLVGISYGGIVVQQFMLRCPGRTRSAVICDSFCDVRPRSLLERIQLWPAHAQPLLLRALPRKVLAASAMSAYSRWPEAGQAMAEVFLSDRMSELIAQRRAVNRVHLESALRRASVPVLCLVGDHSRFAVSMMRRVHESVPHSEFGVIPDSFDPSSLCNPAGFTARVQAWVDARKADLVR
jgi:3-oxoadipate enol-lactonase